ncbi:class I SAM-dependent methyltransferase [Pelagibius marinus]|uniref:class I SAM-dependent methyltransferase n=1 Tax=Pelagibius marinus TaxID=2762760 RepID=UPI00187226D3|nr:methyltransferase domain-containing protein [Pelagibius marinus]
MDDYSVFGERERKGWADDSVAENYVTRFGPITDRIAEQLVSVVAPGPGRDILDLCCGQGNLTARLTESGAKVEGLDFSPTMLEKAARAAPAASLRQGDAQNLPYGEASFDAVTCNFGIPHVPDYNRVLSEVRRVLRPGGTFAFTCWAAPEANPAFGTALRAIKTHADLSSAPPQPDFFQFAHRETAETLLQAAGFRLAAHDILHFTWRLDAPGDLFDIYANATVAVSMLLKSQSAEIVDRIRGEMTAKVEADFAADGGYVVPVPAAMIVARP